MVALPGLDPALRSADQALEVDIWRRWPGCAVGVAGGVVAGIDLDILDGDLAIRTAELAMDTLGDTPCLRVGRAPKRLLVYRTAAPFAGRKRHPLEAWPAAGS